MVNGTIYYKRLWGFLKVVHDLLGVIKLLTISPRKSLNAKDARSNETAADVPPVGNIDKLTGIGSPALSPQWNDLIIGYRGQFSPCIVDWSQPLLE